MSKKLKVVCFGGANIDSKAKAIEEPILGTSNPVRTTLSVGGVACNIASNLAKLKVDTALISRVGKDTKGEFILSSLKGINLDITGVSRSERFPTAAYSALCKADGELFVAMSDMGIYDELTPEFLETQIGKAKNASYWVLDSNLSEKALSYLAQECPKTAKLWALPVSIPKMKRLKKIFPKLDGLIVNIEELSALVQRPILSNEMLEEACESVLQKGVKSMVVTMGKKGACLSTVNGCLWYDALGATAVDVTGAGDAFLAGLIYGLQLGLKTEEAMPYGISLASLTVQTEDTVAADLSVSKISDEMKRIPKDEKIHARR